MICISIPLLSDLPPDLPGEDITEEYSRQIIPRDSVEAKKPAISPESPNWLDKVSKTWDAPDLAKQIAADHKAIPLGKGAIYIPYFTKASLEPEVEIIDAEGKIRASGKPGKKFNLLPGTYYVMIGSGPHNLRMVRTVKVMEGKIIPLIPDWCGLIIDIVDENNVPFRGEYELARIDHFELYGRGRGRDPDLGEELKTWTLKPGVYKIFGVGESYNTLRNFITVRLLPGELTRVLLIETEDDMLIVGGGTVDVTPESKISSHWSYAVDIGGSVEFSSENNRVDDTLDVTTRFTLLINNRFTYDRDPFEWTTSFRMDEGLDIKGLTASGLENSTDDFTIRSRILWRVLSWMGPYGRLELNTGFFPRRIHFDDGRHYFVPLSDDSTIIVSQIDSLNSSWTLEPSFSPLTLETGAGAHADILTHRIVQIRTSAGIGISYNKIWDKFHSGFDTTDVKGFEGLDSAFAFQLRENGKFVQSIEDVQLTEVGPEAMITGNIRLGRWGTAETLLRILAPFDRIEKPNFNWENRVTWRLIRALALVYEYDYELKQPEEEAARVNLGKHRVQLRVSYTSR